MNNQKSYKIIVHSKKMRNIRGSCHAEVAKKVASKLSNKYFSIIEVKTNKIIHYYSDKKELLRPYTKNGKLVKFRIVVKKIKKQFGGTYEPKLDDPKDPIFKFFIPENYVISFKKHNIVIVDNSPELNECLTIRINDNNVELFQLNKCSYQGKTNLEKLIKYIKYLNSLEELKDKFLFIYLYDVSEVKIKDMFIPLWLLSILSIGKSWYNTFGFISDDYDSEIEKNNLIIQKNIKDFLYESYNKLYTRNNINIDRITLKSNKSKKIIEQFLEYYNNDNTVQDIFIEIKNKLMKNDISLEELLIINELLYMITISNIITYEIDLKLRL